MSFAERGFIEVGNHDQTKPATPSNNWQGNRERPTYPSQQYNRPSYSPDNFNGGFNRNSYTGSSGSTYRAYKEGSQGNPAFPRKPQDEGPVELYLPYVASCPFNTPNEIVDKIVSIIKQLDKFGFTMRNGGRDGAEDIFERATTRKEIHLPWKGFMNKESKYSFTPDAAKVLASRFHPGFDGLKQSIQTFLATDVKMVMGKGLTSPALFLITWSADGAQTLQEKSAKTGNAGQAIAVACALNIPIFNFGRPDAEQRLRQHLSNYYNGTNDVSQQPQPQQ